MKKIILKISLVAGLFGLGFSTVSLKEYTGGTGSSEHTCYTFVSSAINPNGDCLAFDCKDCIQKRVNCQNSYSNSSKCTRK